MSEREDFLNELASEALRSGAPVLDAVDALLKHPGREKLRVVELGAHFSTLESSSGRVIRIFRVPTDAGALSELVERVVEHNPRSGSELVILGGGRGEAEAIFAAVPEMMMHPFLAFHRSDAGEVRCCPARKGKKSPRFEALLRVRKLSEPERRAALAMIEGHARSVQNERKERARFFRRMNARFPIATYSLLGVIGLTFLLQHWWGKSISEESILFVSMGALLRPAIDDGEWWRMISAGFLHAGLMHVGMNSFVLYLLGGQTERVLGTPRFLVLYVVSLLGGSLASLHFGMGFSVGASGAVWGLLGAQLALAYGRPPVLPRSIAESLKPMARTNLLLNVGISFLPMIDGAAHFGGGAAGGLLLASGLLYEKSRGEGEPEAKRGKASRPISGEPSWVRVVSLVGAALLFWSLVKAWTAWTPWDLPPMAEATFEGWFVRLQP